MVNYQYRLVNQKAVGCQLAVAVGSKDLPYQVVVLTANCRCQLPTD